MKRFVFVFVLSIITFVSFAQNNSDKEHVKTLVDTSNLPKLGLKEESFDFGKIPQGKPVHHTFEVSNLGNVPFKLINVQASCGCTTPEWEKDKEVAPGGTTNINVGYNAAADGMFTKNITITYGDNLTKVITIKGQVWKTPAASAPSNTATQELKD